VVARLTAFLKRVVAILGKLRHVLTRLHRTRMSRVEKSFKKNSGDSESWISASEALMNAVKDWRTYLGSVVKAESTAVPEAVRLAGSDGGEGDRDEQLDPNS
jgi:hypothetical protein